jgi:hypothetical protein
MSPEERVNEYLTINQWKLEQSSIDLIVADVKWKAFFGMSPLSEEQIRQLVVRWATFHAPGLLLKLAMLGVPSTAPKPAAPPSSSALIDAVKKAMKLINDGVRMVGDDKENVVIGVSGLMANVTTDVGSAALGISWGGALVYKADAGDFHFSASVSKDQWEMTLSFPKDSAVPSLPKLGNVFGEGERAVRKIAGATASFGNVNDASRVGALIKPHVSAVQAAVEAASGIAAAEKAGGMSFGFKLGSPDPLPGQQGMSPGVQGQATITWWF